MTTNSFDLLPRATARALAAARLLLLFGLASWGALCAASAQQSGNEPFCGNPVPPTKPPGCPPQGSGAGVNPVNVNTSDVQREVRDLEVFGGVGEHHLNWTRVGHSRLANGPCWFGDGHIWRHSYQWDMADTGSGQVQITYPDGDVNSYTLSGGAWTSLASNPDLLTQNGTNYYLQRADGYLYHFVRVAVGATVYYQMRDFRDSFGNVYNLTYDGLRRLVLITEPAGRWLRIAYQNMPVNQQQFTKLYSQTTTPAANAWTTVTISNSTAFRYLRYYSTDPGEVESHCNVAEIQFYDTAGNLITGTPFGSTPSTGDDANTFDKAFDGDTATYFDFESKHFGFTGIDLGAGNAKVVGSIRFWPRSGCENLMNGTNPEGGLSGCRFEGSNSAPVTETVITEVDAGYGTGSSQVVTRTVQYNYATFADPVLASGWLTLSGATYGDGSQAAYTYQSVYAGQRPLLASADDPRMAGAATKIKYEFWQAQGNVLGAIYAEHDFTSNQILAKFEEETPGVLTGRKITYANGGVQHVVMGNDSNVASRMDELGNQTALTYTASGSGFLASMNDPLNHTTSYTRDTQGRVLSATYADNTTKSWTRDTLAHVLTHKDERGYTTTWTRDGNGRTTRIDYPDSGYETFTYNGFGQVLSHRQANGGTENFAYDGRGLKTGWTDALNHTTSYGYDANDLLVSVTDPLNHATTYAHNERGQVTQATYADNTSTSYAYDVYGNQLSTTNELGKTWSATFDAYKRRITATDPLNRQTQYWYDELGAGGSGCGGCGSGLGGTGSHLTTVILPSGETTKIGYDLAWRKTSETVGYNTPAAATVTYAYDAAGNVQTATDPRGKATTYAYDKRNRRTSATDPLGHATASTYDAAGNVATNIRADSGVTSYTYDPMDRPSQKTDPLSQVTRMAYDTAGNLTTLTDARNDAYGFTYDLCNRKTGMSYPDNSHEGWTYDIYGNAANYTTRAAQVKTSTYDARNREIDAAWNDGVTPEVITSYDAAGRVLTLNNANSALSYAYDAAGQLQSETQNIAGGPGAQSLFYNYDANGNRAQLTNPDGTQVTYAYTTRNQMSSVSLSGPPPLASYTYDLAGNRTGKNLENGTSAAYTYDDANRLTSLVHQSGNTMLVSFTYAYNNVNNRTSVTYANGMGDVYGYDATDEITGVQYGATNPVSAPINPQGTQGYAYDATGNRTSATQNGNTTAYTANALNEYTQVGGTAQVSDGNGNIIGPVNGFTCAYDAQNRLVSMGMTTGGTRGQPSRSTTYAFAYDARNRCVQRTSVTSSGVQQTSATSCVYDGWNLVAEFDGDSGSQVASYVHGATTDELLVCTNSGGTYYYYHDGLGSTAALTNTSGQMVEQYSYGVFGVPTFKNAAGSIIGRSAYGNRFLFTGREWLSDEGIYDYRNRMYSAAFGRFLQIDPIRFEAGDVNIYNYVLNNSTDYTDPSGLLPASDPKCKALLDKINDNLKRLNGKLREYGNNNGNLPDTTPDDLIKLGNSIRGHDIQIHRLLNAIEKDKDDYKKNCGDPEKCTAPVSVPVLSPKDQQNINNAAAIGVLGGLLLALGALATA